MPKEAEKIWTDVDRYFVETLHLSDPILDSTMKANAAAELPAIDVAPNQGKLLHLLAKLVSAKRILEIGTLGGYSTIWLARALPPNGRLIPWSSARSTLRLQSPTSSVPICQNGSKFAWVPRLILCPRLKKKASPPSTSSSLTQISRTIPATWSGQSSFPDPAR